MNINSIIKTAKVFAAGVTIIGAFGLIVTNYKMHENKDKQIGALLKLARIHEHEIEVLKERLDTKESRCICTTVRGME